MEPSTETTVPPFVGPNGGVSNALPMDTIETPPGEEPLPSVDVCDSSEEAEMRVLVIEAW